MRNDTIALNGIIAGLKADTLVLRNIIAELKTDTILLNNIIANLRLNTSACNQNTLVLLAQINNLKTDTTQLHSTITTLQSDLNDCNTANAALRSDTMLYKNIIVDLLAKIDSLQAKLDSCLNGLTTKSLHFDNLLRVYPNPTNSQLRIENYELSMGEIEIYDVVGKRVGATHALPLQDGNITIDISYLTNGMYFLKIGNRTVKIIKN